MKKLRFQLHLSIASAYNSHNMPDDRDSEDRNRNTGSSKMPQDRDAYDSETNPFVAFRRFADEQVSSLLQSITGLPSTVSPPQSDRWMIFNDDQGYKSMSYRQRSDQNNGGERGNASDPGAAGSSSGDRNKTPLNDSEWPPERSTQYQQPEQEDRWQSPSRRNQRHGGSDFLGLESFFDRFEDHFLPSSSPFFHPHRHFSLFDMFEDSSSPTWPITYIMFSPYSPLHLERQAYYRAHHERGVFTSLMSSFHPDSECDPTEPQWREAFEDLLRLENGKPMLDRQALKAGETETEKDWLHGLVKRGSLGDRWKYVSGTDDQPWSSMTFEGRSEDRRALQDKEEELSETTENREEAESELEMYERYLEDLEARSRELLQGFSQSPILSLLLDERQRRHDGWNQSQQGMAHTEDEQRSEDTETWLDLVSGGNRKSVPETPVEKATTESVKPIDGKAPRVISTISHTERRRLEDGTIQTKIVKTRRFADGREETDESVEVTNPQSGDGKSSDGTKSGGGWFWKD